MKTGQQLAIDNYLVRPLIWMLNLVVRILGKILRINHSLDRPFRRIIVSKYKGMGSIIQATPLLRTLKENFPDTEIIFVSSASNKVFLDQLDPIIDRSIILNDKSFFSLLTSFPGFLLSIIRLRAELWIDLEIYSHAASLIATLSMATNRFGFYLRTSQYRMGIYTHMMFYNVNAPISQTYLQMARRLGCEKIIEELFPMESKEPLPEQLAEKKYMVINPNASDLRIERRWPANNYVQLIQKLLPEFSDYQIVLIGAPSEAAYVSQIANAFTDNDRLIDLSGKTSVGQLITVIQKADLMISNDSGPMHIGLSTKTPMVALFGPCHPQQYGGKALAKVFYKSLYCSPCVHEFQQAPCKGNNLCMQLIQVDEVLQACKEQLEEAHVSPKYFSSAEIKYTVKAGAVFGNFDRE